ncbi:hypothetical protein ACP4OV_002808 [Aristida adscensionis]
MQRAWAASEGMMVSGGKNGGGAGAALLGSSVASWLYRAVVMEPPAPRVCGAAGGPPVTAPRVRVRDGRHLAYCETGVPREKARVRIVFSHGFTGSRLDSLRASEL